ncbi:hypothetical protein, partial [Lentilactobacillus sp. SPB1-3]|uniref:Uncharacterized protein n=1 Tax=Lentilactobacillus terminaliae TaxID=3003483 RepID=A0ACD5DCQ1_9LACO
MVDDFDRLSGMIDKMKDMERNGKQDVPFEVIFPSEFMLEHTNNKFDNVYEFLDSGKFNTDDFDSINEDQLNVFISENTDFENWEDFKGTGTEEYVFRQLGFDN